MPWCPTCYFHRLPRTFHCERCDICVEPVHSILVAVPAGALLVPLILQLFIKAVAVGTARRPYEEKYDRGFNEGCPKNCYIALCAPLGPKYMSEAVCIQVDQGTNWGPKEHLKDLLWPRCVTQAPPRSGKSAPVEKGMPEQQAQLPQTFRVLKGKPTEFPLAVRGVNKYYNASTLKQKKLRLTTPEKDCFPSGTPALNTKGPETSAIVMEEDDGDGEVRPFTAPGHGHTRPGLPEQQAQLPQTFRVLKGKPTEFPLAVRGVNKYYNASTLKQKKLRLTTPEKDCFPSGTPALNTKGPETSAIVMEEDDGDGEVRPFTAPRHGHTRPLKTKGPETLAIIMEEDDDDEEVQP
uniref:uncharacterized protein LOC143407776 n=1 Tax=Callospermophilus lateralis TaxID=76772 RepID=UPI004038B5D5